MKMIEIPESEYKEYLNLKEEVNSLRELVGQFIGKATKLMPRKRGAKELPPTLREVEKVAKMTQKEKIEHIKRKFGQ